MGTKLALALGRREEPHLIEIEYFSNRDHDKTCSANILFLHSMKLLMLMHSMMTFSVSSRWWSLVML